MCMTFWSTKVGNAKLTFIESPIYVNLVVAMYIRGDQSMGFTVYTYFIYRVHICLSIIPINTQWLYQWNTYSCQQHLFFESYTSGCSASATYVPLTTLAWTTGVPSPFSIFVYVTVCVSGGGRGGCVGAGICFITTPAMNQNTTLVILSFVPHSSSHVSWYP